MSNFPRDTYQPETDNHDALRAVLMLTANDTEDLEFFYPFYRFIEAGFRVDVATPKGGELEAKHGLGLKETLKMSDIDAENYDLLYIPGGKAPAELKKHNDALDLTESFVMLGKPIAAICHGPQLLAAAEVIKGVTLTGWPEIEEELRKAGAIYIDRETVVDGHFITARWPGDLPAHMKVTLAVLEDSKKFSMHEAA